MEKGTARENRPSNWNPGWSRWARKKGEKVSCLAPGATRRPFECRWGGHTAKRELRVLLGKEPPFPQSYLCFTDRERGRRLHGKKSRGGNPVG